MTTLKLNEFRLERYFAQHEFSARYLLCCSDSESFSIQEVLDLDPDNERAFKENRLGYTESKGSLEMRIGLHQFLNNNDAGLRCILYHHLGWWG